MHRQPNSRLVPDSGARITERSISYYENDDGVPPSVVMGLPEALQVSAGELLGLKRSTKAAPFLTEQDPETRRLWKRFQVVVQLPERDQRAIVRADSILAAVAAPRRNGTHAGESNGR